MQFGILGPLEVRGEHGPVSLPRSKPRAILALLLLHANEPVGPDRMAVALWGEEAPAGATKTIQVHVSRLRKALGDELILETTPAGYRLHVRPGELDVQHFERLVEDGQRALADGRAERAAQLLREALSLWRGSPLAELAYEPFAQVAIVRLEEQRLSAVELRMDAELAAGHHDAVVGELQQLVASHPTRERLAGQLMLALYRCGRQAEALDVYRRVRTRLSEDLGLNPSTALGDLQVRILNQDPTLANGYASIADEAPPTVVEGAVPLPPNRTVGREHEVAAIRARLSARAVRLLTLIGTGGVGKTRLALEAARAIESDFADGTRFVSLAEERVAHNVPAAIARALAIVALEGESTDRAVERFLGRKHLLLVLDSCERVIGAAPFIARVLALCPGITVMATSREPLDVQAEQLHRVQPLAVDDVADSAAVELFAERVRARDAEFPLDEATVASIADICRRVDGLPLGIELAAARCGVLSPSEIGERLETTLGKLSGDARDAPARQRTLRATVEWSHDLLSLDERACFARFGVFAGATTLDAAEVVTGAGLDTLNRLVAKSLIIGQRHGDGTRLKMLDTVRDYARERLAAASDPDNVRASHYRYFRAFAERHGSQPALYGRARQSHLAKLDLALGDIHAALDWAYRKRDGEALLALCVAVGWYWWLRWRVDDAVAWVDRALSIVTRDEHIALRVRALHIKALALWWAGRATERDAVLHEADAAARSLGDPLMIAEVLCIRSGAEASGGRVDVARRLADEGAMCADLTDDDWAKAIAAFAQAQNAPTVSELRRRVDVAASELEKVGNVYQLASLLLSAPYVALEKDDDWQARIFVERAEPIVRKLDEPMLWIFFHGNSGLTALLIGDTHAARQAFVEQLKLCRTLVAHWLAAEGLMGLAALAAVAEDFPRAARLLGAAVTKRSSDPPDAVQARIASTYFEPARHRHRPDRWDAAVEDGAKLTFDRAIAYALEEPEN